MRPPWYGRKYTRRPSICRGVGCPCSPQSLSYLSSWRFTRLPPTCISKSLGDIQCFLSIML
ncbi:hypothetical protein DXZ79_14860 [Yersinia rochesterensis]|uniref:Uncharacterized protein n=1 Tax=Yersinia rochesterensis TaxID=1604335 RepID=A0A8D4N6V7_9GAMM|nr:hypothetical protein DXZ79_14860 [Yersinia rochesterensis]